MSRFKSDIHAEEIDGRLYLIDAALVPSLVNVPVDLLPPLLDVLDRDLRTRHAAWMKANENHRKWRAPWIEEAIALRYGKRKQSFANIGRMLEAKGHGTADRIARSLARYVVIKK